MKRRFRKRWALIETVGKKPTIVRETYDPKELDHFNFLLHHSTKRDILSIRTETIMCLSVNGALPTHL